MCVLAVVPHLLEDAFLLLGDAFCLEYGNSIEAPTAQSDTFG
jgi:hypothetical protein